MRLEDLGFDSLAFAELAVALEDEQGIDVGDPLLDGTGTVGDLLEVVERADVARSTVDVPSGVGRLQRLADAVGGIGLRAWIRVEVMGAEGVPRHGPAILAMNHESALDIPIIVVASPRPVTFMAKRELFKGRSPRGRCASSGGSVWTASASTSGRSGSPSPCSGGTGSSACTPRGPDRPEDCSRSSLVRRGWLYGRVRRSSPSRWRGPIGPPSQSVPGSSGCTSPSARPSRSSV